MARISRIIDDLTGAELQEDVDPTTITVDGKDYTLDLGSDSKERLVRWLNGEDALIKTAPQASSSRPGTGGGAGRRKIDDYGHDRADVKKWAIAQQIVQKNGKTVSEDTRGLSQDIYDAYNEAHKGA